jgi:MoxR-like ATPase
MSDAHDNVQTITPHGDATNKNQDFFGRYVTASTTGTEVPATFSRWAMISAVGAWIGKSCYFRHGDYKVYPNLYVMLLGAPGTRKSTAIKKVSRILRVAGYDSFSAEKTTKEKFLMDMAGELSDDEKDGDFLDIDLSKEYTECYIAADEFNDFFGNNILEFVSLLGVLWDYSGTYKSKVKNSLSVEIKDPTISILGGNTQTTLANTFPPDVMGQGFFSRMIAIYAEPTGRKITFPKAISEEELKYTVDYLFEIKKVAAGELVITSGAIDLLDTIYKKWKPIDDERFTHYSNRRLTHLIKLVIIHTVTRLSAKIEEQDVVYANTVLSHAEHFMPKAYGEFGRSKNAAASHKVLSAIEGSYEPVQFTDLWSRVSSDLNGIEHLAEITKNLVVANKIQATEKGFLPNKRPLDVQYGKLIDYSYLTDAEINGE